MTEKKILICDDDEGILDMLEMVLINSGYEVIALKDSTHIFEAISKDHPDLLLLDLWMPVISGDEILKALRKNIETDNLPVIIISASPNGHQVAVEAGATDFIGKPFDVHQLIYKVGKLTKT